MNTTETWVTEPLKKKRGRPKKTESVVKPPKRKRGRPKKVKDDSIVLQQPAIKRKRGRPKKEKLSNNAELMQSLRDIAIRNKIARKGDNLLKALRLAQKKHKERYYDISTNQTVELPSVAKKKKSYTYIIEAKVRVVED